MDISCLGKGDLLAHRFKLLLGIFLEYSVDANDRRIPDLGFVAPIEINDFYGVIVS